MLFAKSVDQYPVLPNPHVNETTTATLAHAAAIRVSVPTMFLALANGCFHEQ